MHMIYQPLFRRSVAIVLVLSMLLLAMAVFAGNTFASGITDSIRGADMGDISGTADKAGMTFVSEVRAIAIVVSIVMVIWMGFLLFFGNAQSLIQMKGKLGVLAVALIFTFQTETVLSFVFSLVGYEI